MVDVMQKRELLLPLGPPSNIVSTPSNAQDAPAARSCMAQGWSQLTIRPRQDSDRNEGAYEGEIEGNQQPAQEFRGGLIA